MKHQIVGSDLSVFNRNNKGEDTLFLKIEYMTNHAPEDNIYMQQFLTLRTAGHMASFSLRDDLMFTPHNLRELADKIESSLNKYMRT